VEKLREWEGIYLKDAHERLQKQMDGYELSIRDVANMVSSLLPPLYPIADVKMEICPYEVSYTGSSGQ
jgi:hypothetical protein